MLKEINCKQFIKTPLAFDKGLNSILGDDYSTNSIGKSTLLMIIDFVFGGSSYIENNSGAIKELGHHSFNFNFIFNNQSHYYSRSTENPMFIGVCDKNYNQISEINARAFTEELKELYAIKNSSSFRSMVNPYSRIWKKGNYNVDKPIHNHIQNKESEAVDNLIKLFNLFDTISETKNKIKEQQESKKVLNGLHKKNYVQKITKRQFEQNQVEIERIQNEIKTIQNNLLKFTLNIEELTNKELIDLKTKKKRLLDSQALVLNKIRRLDLSLGKRKTKSKYFTRLSEFFENPNEEKIEEIETFHSKISSILARELGATKKLLEEENEYFKEEIKAIDIKIDSLLQNVKSPKFIVDKIYDLTVESNKLSNVNKFYKEKEEVLTDIKSLTEKLEGTIVDILREIEEKINTELVRINKEIHTEKKKTPSIKLTRNSYSFDHSSNTGTGKSFADLIEFDLSILKLTELPFIIHDSVLFKNIEDFAVDKIIEQYTKFDKQIFMALDGINKYSVESQKILKENKVIELSESNKLFNRDWR